MNLAHVPAEAYESGLLNREYHERLLLNAESVTKKAGVPLATLWSKLSNVCVKNMDYDWVRDLKRSEDGGLLYLGPQSVPVEEKMRGIVGVCLRNYTDARLVSVQRVIKQVKDDELGSPTVLLIPNFCLASDTGLKDWQAHELLGLLIDRATEGKKTVLYGDSWEAIETTYGPMLREHLETYYAICTAKKLTPARIAA
jgi:hypothetical protein